MNRKRLFPSLAIITAMLICICCACGVQNSKYPASDYEIITEVGRKDVYAEDDESDADALAPESKPFEEDEAVVEPAVKECDFKDHVFELIETSPYMDDPFLYEKLEKCELCGYECRSCWVLGLPEGGGPLPEPGGENDRMLFYIGLTGNYV